MVTMMNQLIAKVMVQFHFPHLLQHAGRLYKVTGHSCYTSKNPSSCLINPFQYMVKMYATYSSKPVQYVAVDEQKAGNGLLETHLKGGWGQLSRADLVQYT